MSGPSTSPAGVAQSQAARGGPEPLVAAVVRLRAEPSSCAVVNGDRPVFPQAVGYGPWAAAPYLIAYFWR